MRQKNNLLQLFCKHINSSWYKKEVESYDDLNRERRYKICNDCGKLVDEYSKIHIDENYM